MRETYFDRLPVELIHHIFCYFSCDQIVYSFYWINDYLNNIIRNYDHYFLDFSSSDIRKNVFDIICSIISPKQIIGLKVGKTRFNLIDRYLNNLKNDKSFIRLRSLWLDERISFNEINSQWINSIFEYNNLCLFRFDSTDECLFLRSSSSFKNLLNLVGCSSTIFLRLSKEIPKHLTFLHMFFDSIDDLCCLLNENAHQLKSLGIGIKCLPNNIDQFFSLFNNYQWKKLIQFNLNLQMVDHVQWIRIKEMLSPMSRLRYLTLIFSKQISMNSHLFSGNQWKLFLSISFPYLKRFSLKLPVEDQSEDRIKHCVHSFQTSWWLNVKQWFVDYLPEENAFITVPDYSPRIFDNLNLKIHSKLFYSNITELKLNLIESNDLKEFLILKDEDRSCFIHVTRLSLDGYLTKDISDRLRHHIDIQKIKHFQILSGVDDLYEFAQLMCDMPHLLSLDIQCMHSLRLFRLISSPLFSVRHLVLIGSKSTTIKRVYFDLCRLFPHLTELTTEYHSRRILSYLLNNLFHLEQMTFRLNSHEHVPNHHWIEKHTRLISDSFESNVFNVNYRERLFFIWINQDKNIDQSSHHKCPVQ